MRQRLFIEWARSLPKNDRKTKTYSVFFLYLYLSRPKQFTWSARIPNCALFLLHLASVVLK